MTGFEIVFIALISVWAVGMGAVLTCTVRDRIEEAPEGCCGNCVKTGELRDGMPLWRYKTDAAKPAAKRRTGGNGE